MEAGDFPGEELELEFGDGEPRIDGPPTAMGSIPARPFMDALLLLLLLKLLEDRRNGVPADGLYAEDEMSADAEAVPAPILGVRWEPSIDKSDAVQRSRRFREMTVRRQPEGDCPLTPAGAHFPVPIPLFLTADDFTCLRGLHFWPGGWRRRSVPAGLPAARTDGPML